MKIIIPIAALILASSCTPILSPYTSNVQQQTHLDDTQLKQIQFYLSDDIVLYRDLANSETEIAGGEIKIINGQKVEEVVIKAGTPGVIIDGENSDKLKVSFDTNGSYLLFGPNADYGGKYTMMAKEWKGRTGIVDYEGKEYRASAESIFAYLMISMKQIDNSTIDSKQASGRTLGS